MTQSDDPTEIPLGRGTAPVPNEGGSIFHTATALFLTGGLFVGVVGTQGRFNRMFREFGTKLMPLTDFLRSPSFAWLAGTLFVVTIGVEFGLKRRKWKTTFSTIAILVAVLMAAVYVVGMFLAPDKIDQSIGPVGLPSGGGSFGPAIARNIGVEL